VNIDGGDEKKYQSEFGSDVTFTSGERWCAHTATLVRSGYKNQNYAIIE